MTERRNPWSNAISDNEREAHRRCQREHRASWFANVYRANYSAFNGYSLTPSDYSEVHCRECGRVWRTKAAYVDGLPMGRSALDNRPSS